MRLRSIEFLSDNEKTDISEKLVEGSALPTDEVLFEIEQIGFSDLTINKRYNCDHSSLPIR